MMKGNEFFFISPITFLRKESILMREDLLSVCVFVSLSNFFLKLNDF